MEFSEAALLRRYNSRLRTMPCCNGIVETDWEKHMLCVAEGFPSHGFVHDLVWAYHFKNCPMVKEAEDRQIPTSMIPTWIQGGKPLIWTPLTSVRVRILEV